MARSWLLRAQHPFPNSPKELRSPVSFPSPAVGETSQHCGLDMASSLWAGNSAQSRHRIGKHFLFTSGSLWGDSQGLQPARKPAGAWNRVRDGGGGSWPFLWGRARASREAEGSLLGPQLAGHIFECWDPEACRQSLSLGKLVSSLGMPMAPTTPVATTLPSCLVQQHELCTAHLQCAWYSLQLCKLVALLPLQTSV